LPVANTRGFASYEILKINRLIFRPYPAGAAKVGHARFGADSRAGEKDNVAVLSQACSEFFKFHADNRQLQAPSLF
jgi:hypothetical protein